MMAPILFVVKAVAQAWAGESLPPFPVDPDDWLHRLVYFIWCMNVDNGTTTCQRKVLYDGIRRLFVWEMLLMHSV